MSTPSSDRSSVTCTGPEPVFVDLSTETVGFKGELVISPYDNNQTCRFVLLGGEGGPGSSRYFDLLAGSVFDTEEIFDVVRVYYADETGARLTVSPLATLSGVRSAGSVLASAPTFPGLLVEFKSDESITGDGAIIQYELKER